MIDDPELAPLAALCRERMSPAHHGDSRVWLAALERLPDVRPSDVDFGDTVRVGRRGDITQAQAGALEASLRALQPWRKGPFEFFGLHVDTEWRSDWKWARIAPALGDIAGASILDVGAGNGYYGWRMLQAGADRVLGVDPMIVFNMQHRVACRYMGDISDRNTLLPIRFEEFPAGPEFDLVFSMGVIYHRRDPHEHIGRLRSHVAPGGRVVVETLVVGSEHAPALRPDGRYARMRNVSCIPTVGALQAWLSEAGFDEPEVVSVGRTTTAEQRTTGWMRFESLAEALDRADPTRTVEGWPAPVRAIVTARLR